MTGSRRARRNASAIVAFALGIAATSCGEFVRNNPFDPAVPVKITIQGPDSAFAQFDTLRFTLTTDPVYDYAGLVEWQISGLQKVDNNGTYQVGPIQTYSGQPARVAVSVRIGSRTASKDVNIVFKPVGASASFCRNLSGGGFLLDTARATVLDWIGQSIGLCASVVDAHGGIISTSRQLSSSARSLDTTVARIDPFGSGIVAAGNGTTGIVLTNGTRVDTLRVTVQQAVRYLTVSPAACAPPPGQPGMTIALGDTVRLSLVPPAYDLGRTPITDPAIIQSAIAQAQWGQDPYYGGVPISVTTDGLVKATTRGYAVAQAVLSDGFTFSGPVATCPMVVQ